MNGCPDREKTIWLYVLGELPEDRRRALADHLANCASCRSELRRFQTLLETVKTSGRAPRLSRQNADAMTRRILERFDSKRGSEKRRWLTWPRLVPSLAAGCALLLFVGIFSYRALDEGKKAPLMSGLQKEQMLSPEDLQTIQDQDLELLMEFQTVEKLVRVLDASSTEGQRIDNNDNALRKRIHALEA
jgi:hypothetical protein